MIVEFRSKRRNSRIIQPKSLKSFSRENKNLTQKASNIMNEQITRSSGSFLAKFLTGNKIQRKSVVVNTCLQREWYVNIAKGYMGSLPRKYQHLN